MEKGTFIASIGGAALNIGVSLTLLQSQLKQSMENAVLISFFLTTGISCYLTFSGHFGCKESGFGSLIANLSSQVGLLCITWKYTIKNQYSKWWYIGSIWTFTTIAVILVPSNDSKFERGVWNVCIKDFDQKGGYWMALETLTIFFSTLTLCLALLALITVTRNREHLLQKKRHGFLRLFAFMVFDSILCLIGGVYNMLASLTNHSPAGIAFVLSSLQFLHTIMSPILFLFLHNGIRKAMVRLATANKYGNTISPTSSKLLGDYESLKADSPSRSRNNLLFSSGDTPTHSPYSPRMPTPTSLASSPKHVQIYDDSMRSALNPLTSRSPTKQTAEI